MKIKHLSRAGAKELTTEFCSTLGYSPRVVPRTSGFSGASQNPLHMLTDEDTSDGVGNIISLKSKDIVRVSL